MMKWIEALVQTVRIEIALWRCRHERMTAREMFDGIDAARAKFPNDPVFQRSAALSEMELRRILGRRVHDA